jgi:hypothetical protein
MFKNVVRIRMSPRERHFFYRCNCRFQLNAMVDQWAYGELQTPPIPQRLLTLAEVRW